jgi:hypothetical protein
MRRRGENKGRKKRRQGKKETKTKKKKNLHIPMLRQLLLLLPQGVSP